MKFLKCSRVESGNENKESVSRGVRIKKSTVISTVNIKTDVPLKRHEIQYRHRDKLLSYSPPRTKRLWIEQILLLLL